MDADSDQHVGRLRTAHDPPSVPTTDRPPSLVYHIRQGVHRSKGWDKVPEKSTLIFGDILIALIKRNVEMTSFDFLSRSGYDKCLICFICYVALL